MERSFFQNIFFFRNSEMSFTQSVGGWGGVSWVTLRRFFFFWGVASWKGLLFETHNLFFCLKISNALPQEERSSSKLVRHFRSELAVSGRVLQKKT